MENEINNILNDKELTTEDKTKALELIISKELFLRLADKIYNAPVHKVGGVVSSQNTNGITKRFKDDELICPKFKVKDKL